MNLCSLVQANDGTLLVLNMRFAVVGIWTPSRVPPFWVYFFHWFELRAADSVLAFSIQITSEVHQSGSSQVLSTHETPTSFDHFFRLAAWVFVRCEHSEDA